MRREIYVNSKGRTVYRYFDNYICQFCGKEFEARKDFIHSYCSHDCQIESMKKDHNKICIVCGKEFNSRFHPQQKYCSQKCMGLDRKAEIVNTSSYKQIKHNGKIRQEHDVIMEQFIGRDMRPDEVVHHIDGDKRNNCLSNLVLMTRSEHNRMHLVSRLNKTTTRKDKGEKHGVFN